MFPDSRLLLFIIIAASLILDSLAFDRYHLRGLSTVNNAVSRLRITLDIMPISSTACRKHKDFSLFSGLGDSNPDDVDETTKKFGLEAGLYKAVTEPEKSKTTASDLLKKYGIAYLVTSITLASISFAISYLLVANGVDVASLLRKIGIESTTATANAGTFGIAYAIHKAASPIRFPPTVALTPVVAGWLGKKNDVSD